MATKKQTSQTIKPIVGWILVAREELSGGKLGGWYIAWLEPFSTKKQALEFAQSHHWPKPYRAMRGQLRGEAMTLSPTALEAAECAVKTCLASKEVSGYINSPNIIATAAITAYLAQAGKGRLGDGAGR